MTNTRKVQTLYMQQPTIDSNNPAILSSTTSTPITVVSSRPKLQNEYIFDPTSCRQIISQQISSDNDDESRSTPEAPAGVISHASPMQSDTTSRPSQSHNSPPGHLRPNSADCYAEVGSQVSDHNNESVIPAQYNSSPSSPGMVEVGGEQAVAEDGLLNETGVDLLQQQTSPLVLGAQFQPSYNSAALIRRKDNGDGVTSVISDRSLEDTLSQLQPGQSELEHVAGKFRASLSATQLPGQQNVALAFENFPFHLTAANSELQNNARGAILPSESQNVLGRFENDSLQPTANDFQPATELLGYQNIAQAFECFPFQYATADTGIHNATRDSNNIGVAVQPPDFESVARGFENDVFHPVTGGFQPATELLQYEDTAQAFEYFTFNHVSGN